MINITLDQLIADLCVCRGKATQVGTFFIQDSSVSDNAWRLTITDGRECFLIELAGGHEEGNEFEAAVATGPKAEV